MDYRQSATKVALLSLLTAATLLMAETRKQVRFTVGPRASVTILNQYGPITVTPAPGTEVVVIAILHSNKVEIDQNQSGNRVDLVSHLLNGADADSGWVEYQVMVPADASITLHSSTGPLQAERLHGDLTLEGANAKVTVRDVSNAHVHVKTLNGPVFLTNINDGHVEITSIGGDVTMDEVSGPFVQVNCSRGRILYTGDFGSAGEYTLMSHTGDIDANVASYASFDVTARSMKGKVENDFALEPKHTPFSVKAGNAFAGTLNKAASSVKLLSFSGKIHLRKR